MFHLKTWRLLLPVGILTLATSSLSAAEGETSTIDPGSTAWMLTSCALVLLMTPGLALFYGGMVRTKNVLGTMMHSMFCMSLVTIQWVIIGYSLAFGSSQGGFLGGLVVEYINAKARAA